MLNSERAIVTGAASGIGRACARALLDAGAVVVGVDKDIAIFDTFDDDTFIPVHTDVRDLDAMQQALQQAAPDGHLDIVIGNVGVFSTSQLLEDLDMSAWHELMSVNVDSTLTLLRDAYPYLKRSPSGGRVVLLGSKSYLAPGKNSLAYSCSKAVLAQIARIAALEWADDGIRVHIVHPNRVMDTKIYDDGQLERRAAAYGVTPEAYITDNLLQTSVKSADVAAVVLALCGPEFAKMTGLQIPIDGGNLRVL